MRVLPQALRGEVGPEDGCWNVPPGWYYTDTGRARVAAGVDVWSTQAASLEAKVRALELALLPPPAPPPSLPYLPVSAALVLGLLFGFVLGRLTRRKEQP